MKTVRNLGLGLGLVLLYVLLFATGAAHFSPVDGDPESGGRALLAMFACGVIDTVILGALAARTRLRGLARWAALSWAFYGTKTLTSQIEALWFMPNVSGDMAPALFAMTLPLGLIFPLAVAAAWGGRGPVEGPAWRAPPVSAARSVLDVALLSIIVYPALFWSAGYFVAFRSAALRDFYGGTLGDSFASHMWGVLTQSPAVLAFEAFRGALWISFVLPLLRSSAGRWTGDALRVALLFAFVQNDVHLIPNPLMSPEIRLYHFLETASSNFVWGLVLTWVLVGRHRPVLAEQEIRLERKAS